MLHRLFSGRKVEKRLFAVASEAALALLAASVLPTVEGAPGAGVSISRRDTLCPRRGALRLKLTV
jgi:hypothetical protein